MQYDTAVQCLTTCNQDKIYFSTLITCPSWRPLFLAHKLIAAREKDEGDIKALCLQLGIATRRKAQKVLDKYISQEIQENHHAAEKLDIFFG